MRNGRLARGGFIALTLICAALLFELGEHRVARSSELPAAGGQDVMNLDRRISTLEQRLFLMESNISRLQQQAFSQRSAPATGQSDIELNLVRTQLELLTARMRELECGLAHVDERTLSASAKAARDRAGTQPKEPCRADPETPIQISPRR